jgi:hypothetical protein
LSAWRRMRVALLRPNFNQCRLARIAHCLIKEASSDADTREATSGCGFSMSSCGCLSLGHIDDGNVQRLG